jgi:hypothetical protein
MKLLRLLAPACALFSLQAFAGGSLDLSVNDSTAALEYDATRMGTALHVSAGALHHETDGDLVSFGINAVDVRTQNSPLRIGVGGKVYGYSTDDADGGALAIGGFARYTPASLAGLGFAGHAYYAPSVLSFDDTEHLVDLGVRVEYKLLPTAVVYLGYRFFEATEESQDIEIANAGHFGLRINF